jgi:hypothetical protein
MIEIKRIEMIEMGEMEKSEVDILFKSLFSNELNLI